VGTSAALSITPCPDDDPDKTRTRALKTYILI